MKKGWCFQNRGAAIGGAAIYTLKYVNPSNGGPKGPLLFGNSLIFASQKLRAQDSHSGISEVLC